MPTGHVDTTLRGQQDVYPSPAVLTSALLRPTVTVIGSGGGTTPNLYGPNGTEWFTYAPPDTSVYAITASPSTFLSVIGNISTGQANAIFEVGLLDGEYAPTPLTIPQSAALHAANQAVLVRAVNPGGARFTSGVLINCSNIALTYCQIGGVGSQWGFHNATAMQQSAFLRCYLPGNSGQFILNSTDNQRCGVIGCALTDKYASNGDRIHVNALGKPATDFVIDRTWCAGITDDGTGGHTDTAQWTAMLGTHRMTNSFFGQAGNNGTSQINSENQGTFTPYGTYSADSCWYGGGAGQGNSSSFAGPDVRNNCTFYNPAGGSAFRSNGATNAMGLLPKVTNSTFYGSVAGNLSADSTGNTSLPFDPNFTIPTFTKPPWAWW